MTPFTPHRFDSCFWVRC